MPLTEFLRMFNENGDATNDRAATANLSRQDSDFVELVWENGQITTQGQSSKARKFPSTNDFQTYMPKPQDLRDDTGSKMAKFSIMDTAFSDFPSYVPSWELGLDQDVEMVPWLSYPTEDALHSDYACNFLPELSSVTLNDTPTVNHISVKERKSGCLVNGHDKSMNSKHGDAPKAGSNTGQKYARGESSEVPQTSSRFQHNVLRSGTSGITGENLSYPNHLASRDSSLSAFSSLRLQKLNGGQSSTSCGFTNFSYFSRPVAVARASHQTVHSSNRLDIGAQRCTVTSSNPVNSSVVNLSSGFSQKDIISNVQSALEPVAENLEILPTKTNEELLSSNQAIRREAVAKKDILLPQAHDLGKSEAVMDGDKNMEPVVVASSVCSGNSVERASSESPAHNLKRKSRETAESEDPSEEVEGEPVGAEKGSHALFGSKRTRAAEVHNLSERRRRDRINEKMHSLQELIPNCNKVDKASMLDEAIEYLKTLQLQVQMLSMGAGFYMPPMIMPPGVQPIHGADMPHFSPMGLGMDFGMSMLDVNGGMKMLPFQGPHYPIPGAGAPFHGMPSHSLQGFGHPGQGLAMSMQRGTVIPVPCAPPLNVPMGLNLSGVTCSKDASHLAPSSSCRDAGAQVIPSNNLNSSTHQAPNQVSNEQIQPSASSPQLTKAIDASSAPKAPHETDLVRN